MKNIVSNFYLFINLFLDISSYIYFPFASDRQFFVFPGIPNGKYEPFDARKYLRSAITEFLFHLNDHQWSEVVFTASSSRPTSDHSRKGVEEYTVKRTFRVREGTGTMERQRSKGWIEV